MSFSELQGQGVRENRVHIVSLKGRFEYPWSVWDVFFYLKDRLSSALEKGG